MVSLAISTASRSSAERDHAGHRAEDLLARRPVGVRDRGQHRGREPVARSIRRRAADRDRRVIGHEGGDRLPLLGRDQRPHLRRLVERIAHPHRLNRPLERLQEAVDDRPLDQDPRARAAVLARVAEHGRRRRRGRSLEIGVGEHDVRRLAPQLQGDPLDRRRGPRGDPAPHLGRAGEGDLGHVGVLHQPPAADAARPGDHVQDALAEARRRARSAPAPRRSAASARRASAPPCCPPPAPAPPSTRRSGAGSSRARSAPPPPAARGRSCRCRRRPGSSGPGAARGRRRSSGRCPPPSPSRRGRRRSACRRCAPPASPGRRLGRRARRRGGGAGPRGRPGRRPARPGRPPLARATAASVSSTPALGTSAITCSVAGSTTWITPSPTSDLAASTSDAITRLRPSSSGCQRTPSANRWPGSSIASTRSSLTDQPLATSPSPSSSTPWWWWDLTATT